MTLTILNELIETRFKYNHLRKQLFFEEVIFSYQWWILILITVGVWVLWAIVVDRSRFNTILLVGFITTILATVFDDIGISLGLWFYPYQITYFTSRLTPVDMSIVPVFYMLLYQYFSKWKPYLITLFLLCLFAVFVAEPFFVLLNMYIKLNWEYWYSGPIYILIGIIVKVVVDRLFKNTMLHH